MSLNPSSSCFPGTTTTTITGLTFAATTAFTFASCLVIPITVSLTMNSASESYYSMVVGTVDDRNWCTNLFTVSNPSPALGSQTYNVGDIAQTFSFNSFTISTTCSDTWVWTLSTTTLPSSLTFNSATRTFTAYSITNADVGTTSITVTGMLPNYQTKTMIFSY
jgi:hypothetical protein